ncbi:hypothetical protein P7C73_g5207, partial [Tremellales sp. Uapishka_1]
MSSSTYQWNRSKLQESVKSATVDRTPTAELASNALQVIKDERETYVPSDPDVDLNSSTSDIDILASNISSAAGKTPVYAQWAAKTIDKFKKKKPWTAEDSSAFSKVDKEAERKAKSEQATVIGAVALRLREGI